jgi:hypothetical protein
MNKTVFFLGAGFSKDAGAPLQGEIMELINTKLRNEDDLRVKVALEKFDLVVQTLGVSRKFISDYTLEDLLTPIDRCIRDNVPLKSISAEKLRSISESIYFLVGRSIESKLKESRAKDAYMDVFAKYLIRESKKRAGGGYKEKSNDPVAAISTNWDIVLDNRLFYHLHTSSAPKGTVDYCCRVSSFDVLDESVKPGLEVLGSGGYCVKYMKLHGSLNWLCCPNCQRTYVDSFDKVALREQTSCRHCRNNEVGHAIMLEPNVIMPTYLKDLSSLQYKMIWQQAANELAEASKVVFMGYSLPQADFEIRQMLTRMVHPQAKIVMVTKTVPTVNGGRDEPALLAKRKAEKEKAYNVFFGREVEAHHDGVEVYVLNNFRE